MSIYQQCNNSKLMICIERFVEKTIQERALWCGFQEELEYLVKEIDYEYTPSLQYSAYIQALLVLIDECRNFGKVDYQQLREMGYRAIRNIFLRFERQQLAELNSFSKSEERNRTQLVGYLNKLITHYSRLLFVRIDLAYKKEKHLNIDIRAFRDHVRKLIGFIQDGDRCFRDLEGYAWALEQGEEKGYHCHLLLIYNGAARKQDYYHADKVIEKWKDIVGEDWSGFNCNTKEHKDQFRSMDKLGIGMIYRDNPKQVINAINTCAYLVNPEKTNQYLRVKVPMMRTFGTGSYQRSYRRYK